MNILNELETASKWSKILSYVYLLNVIFSVISIAMGAFLIYAGETVLPEVPADEAKEMATAFGTIYIAGNVFWIVFCWICRGVFARYQQALTNAAQSLSPRAIEEVCRYQRNVFIVYAAYYLSFIIMTVLAIFAFIFILTAAIGSVSGAVS